MKAIWTEKLLSGNDTIDAQHKDLFEHINVYFDSLTKPFGNDITIKTLNFLVKYVRFHFTTEEDMMKSSAYPESTEHIASHRMLVDELMACYRSLINDGQTEEMVERLRVLLQEWLVGHIMTLDIQLAEYLRDKITDLN